MPFHAIRMMRKLRLTGLVLGPSGELFRSEMAGPMTYDQWEACFMVFRWAMVMLEFASTSARLLGSGRSVGLLSIKPIRG